MTKVAVLGTGRMGGAIAHRLKAGGFQISVWDRTKSKAEALDVGRVLVANCFLAIVSASLTRELFDSVASQPPDLDLSAIVNAYSTDLPPERQKKEV